VIFKIIQWPQEICFLGLDILRLLILHSHAALHYADVYKSGKEDSILDIVLSFLLDESLSETNHMMSWCILVNLFKEEKCRTDTIMEILDEVINLAQCFSKHKNENIRLAVVTILLNFSVELSKIKEIGGKQSEIVPLLVEMIKLDESIEILFRIVLALGTCAHNNEEIKDIIKNNSDKLEFEVLQENAKDDVSKFIESLNELKTLIFS